LRAGSTIIARRNQVLGVYCKEIDAIVALAPALLAKHPAL
jgi:hypothetical protein